MSGSPKAWPGVGGIPKGRSDPRRTEDNEVRGVLGELSKVPGPWSSRESVLGGEAGEEYRTVALRGEFYI